MSLPRIIRVEEVDWYQPPGHFRGFSKLLVGPTISSQNLDFRLSLYPPEGYVEEHVHQQAENIYYIIRGTATVDLDGQREIVGPNSAIFIPPGVRHSLRNNGTEDLLFIVIASPADDMPR